MLKHELQPLAFAEEKTLPKGAHFSFEARVFAFYPEGIASINANTRVTT